MGTAAMAPQLTQESEAKPLGEHMGGLPDF
jgi:hypothetical protein